MKLLPGQKIVRFRNTGGTLLTRKGIPKVFCLDCGEALRDSSVRPIGLSISER